MKIGEGAYGFAHGRQDTYPVHNAYNSWRPLQESFMELGRAEVTKIASTEYRTSKLAQGDYL
jgi:hypothetical protein